MSANAAAVTQVLVLSVMVACLYAVVASGLALEWGVTGIVNFAHGEFVMLGAYITFFLYSGYHVHPLVGALVAAAAMAVLSSVVYRTVLRRVLRGVEHDQVLATLGLSIVLQNLAIMWWTPDYRALQVPDLLPTLHFGPVVVPGNNLFAAVLGGCLYLLLLLFLKRTRYGLMLRMARDNRQLALFSGVNVDRMTELSFVIGGALAGAAGTVVAVTLYVHPLVGHDQVLRGFAIVALGGLGSIPGALVGSAVLALGEGMSSAFIPQGSSWGYGVVFFVLLLVLILRPSGLGRGRA